MVLDYFSYKNGPNDLVRGLFSRLDIGTYILSTCGPSSTFLGSFGGSLNAPKQHKKSIFWLFWTISPTKMGQMIWLGAYF
jgi:hypothetical protein